MKLITTLLISTIASGASASSYDPKVQALYSPALIEAIIKGQIEKSKHKEPIYIHNTVDDVADREFQAKVSKLGERYVGR